MSAQTIVMSYDKLFTKFVVVLYQAANTRVCINRYSNFVNTHFVNTTYSYKYTYRYIYIYIYIYDIYMQY